MRIILLAVAASCISFGASAELVRCTSKDGKSSVIRKDKCDSPDDIRTPAKATAALPSSSAPAAPAPAARSADDAMTAYQAKDFEARAMQGDPLAQLMLGDIYKSGRGVPKDEAMGFFWTKKAATQGDMRGQAALAALMQAGSGTPRDDAGAAVWLEKSAQQGFAIAQTALGSAYLEGRGVPKSDEKARFWLGKAAAQGNTDAAQMLKALGR